MKKTVRQPRLSTIRERCKYYYNLLMRKSPTEYDDVLEHVLRHHWFDEFNWLMTEFDCTNLYKCLTSAIKQRSIPMLEALYKHRHARKMMERMLDLVAEYGGVEVLEWVQSRLPGTCTQSTLDAAVRSGCMKTVQWVLTTNPSLKLTEDSIVHALSNVNYDMLRWFHECNLCPPLDYHGDNPWLKFQPRCRRFIPLGEASGGGDIETLNEFYRRFQFPLDDGVITSALRCNQLAVVRWLVEEAPVERDDIVCRLVRRSFHTTSHEIIEYLYNHPSWGGTVPVSYIPWMEAITGNNLTLLRWLRQNGYIQSLSLGFFEMETLSFYGYCELAQWLHQTYTISCNQQAANNAAIYGHVELAKWIYQTFNMMCDQQSFRNAVERGNFEVVDWAYQTGRFIITGSMLKSMMHSCSPEQAEKFCKYFPLITKPISTNYSVSHGNVSILRWYCNTFPASFVKPPDREAVAKAEKSGYQATIRFVKRRWT